MKNRLTTELRTAVRNLPVRNLMVAGFFVLAELTYGQEVTVNVPVSQPGLLKIDAGPDIRMQVQGTITLGEETAISGGSPDYTFTWKDEIDHSYDGLIINVSSPGMYILTVTDEQNCSAVDSVMIIDAVSTGSPRLENSTLYPNPSGGEVFIPVQPDGSVVRVKIYSINGSVPGVIVIHPDPGIVQIGLRLDHLQAGLYYIRLTDRHGTRTYSFVKK